MKPHGRRDLISQSRLVLCVALVFVTRVASSLAAEGTNASVVPRIDAALEARFRDDAPKAWNALEAFWRTCRLDFSGESSASSPKRKPLRRAHSASYAI